MIKLLSLSLSSAKANFFAKIAKKNDRDTSDGFVAILLLCAFKGYSREDRAKDAKGTQRLVSNAAAAEE